MTKSDLHTQALTWVREHIDASARPLSAELELIEPRQFTMPADEVVDAGRLRDDIFDARVLYENYKVDAEPAEALMQAVDELLDAEQVELWCDHHESLETLDVEEGLRSVGLVRQAIEVAPARRGIRIDYSAVLAKLLPDPTTIMSARAARASMLSGSMLIDLSKQPIKGLLDDERGFKRTVKRNIDEGLSLIYHTLRPSD